MKAKERQHDPLSSTSETFENDAMSQERFSINV